MNTLPQLIKCDELYFLQKPEEFALWYHYLKHRIVFDINWPDGGYEGCRIPNYVPRDLAYSWSERISQGFGGIDQNHSPDQLREALTNARQRADEYVWLFPNQQDYLKGASQDYVNAVADSDVDGAAKLMLFGSFSKDGKPTNTPQYIAANAKQLRNLPFDALTVFLRDGEQTYDQGLTRKLFSTQSVAKQQLLDAITPLQGLTRFEYWIEMYAGLSLAPSLDDNKGWNILLSNCQRFGSVVRQMKLAGVFIDTENYDGRNNFLSCDPDKITPTQELAAFARGAQVMAALKCRVMTTASPIWAMTSPRLENSKNYELYGAFIAGMVGN